jgi:hypothetical protein
VKLDDDDPFWERHLGKNLHQGPEWQQGHYAASKVDMKVGHSRDELY